MIEMHSIEVYKENHLLVIGGRGYFPGESFEQIAFQNTIYAIDVSKEQNEGKVRVIGRLPSDLGSHVSAIIGNKYLLVYGGTNGGRFFDSVLRYDMDAEKWTLMTKQPENCKKSKFFQDGRISCASVLVSNELWVIFGGSALEKDYNDFLIIPVSHLMDDINFSEITEIM